MKKQDFLYDLSQSPVIMAVKSDEDLDCALKKENKIIFFLYGDLLSLHKNIEKVLQAGKKPFVHLNMIEGLENKSIGVDYICRSFYRNCGVISTNHAVVHRCIASNIRVVQRVFALDSLSLESTIEQIGKHRKPDAIEIIPGTLPKAVKMVKNKYPRLPIISGGLIREKEEVSLMLQSGCIGISTTQRDLWK